MMTELDITSIGVLTEHEYRKTATVKAVKADPRKFGMIRDWAGGKIKQFDSCEEPEMNPIIGWEIDTRGAGLIGGNGSDINRELIFFGKHSPAYYICKGLDGEVWPVRADIFEKTYEEIR